MTLVFADATWNCKIIDDTGSVTISSCFENEIAQDSTLDFEFIILSAYTYTNSKKTVICSIQGKISQSDGLSADVFLKCFKGVISADGNTMFLYEWDESKNSWKTEILAILTRK